jgi:hypothetical protein
MTDGGFHEGPGLSSEQRKQIKAGEGLEKTRGRIARIAARIGLGGIAAATAGLLAEGLASGNSVLSVLAGMGIVGGAWSVFRGFEGVKNSENADAKMAAKNKGLLEEA